MALSVDDVHLAVAIHVIANDRKSRIAQLPVGVPLPVVFIGIDVPEPSGRSK